MHEDLSENISISFQRFLPLFTSIFLLFLTYVPLESSFINNVRPAMGIICAYFWLLNRPDVFNLWSLSILALVEDIISSAPLGSALFTMLLLYVLVTNLAKYFNAKPFVVVWYGFIAISLAVMLSRWFIVSIYYGQFLPLSILMFSCLATIAFYPLISLFNAFIQNAFIREEV